MLWGCQLQVEMGVIVMKREMELAWRWRGGRRGHGMYPARREMDDHTLLEFRHDCYVSPMFYGPAELNLKAAMTFPVGIKNVGPRYGNGRKREGEQKGERRERRSATRRWHAMRILCILTMVTP